jgi:hypothetical protein
MRKVQTKFSVGYGVLDVHWNRVTLYTYDPELLLDITGADRWVRATCKKLSELR